MLITKVIQFFRTKSHEVQALALWKCAYYVDLLEAKVVDVQPSKLRAPMGWHVAKQNPCDMSSVLLVIWKQKASNWGGWLSKDGKGKPKATKLPWQMDVFLLSQWALLEDVIPYQRLIQYTYPVKIGHPKRKFIFQLSTIHFQVAKCEFQGGYIWFLISIPASFCQQPQ